MDILYENDSIIVCIKPHGVCSQKSCGENMPDILCEKCGVAEIFPVHRLDTITSGVMVYAKTKKAAACLSRSISENKFRKTYIAAVHGRPQNDEGLMEDLLFKDSRKNKSYVVKRERKGVKKAALTYKILSSCNTKSHGVITLVEIKLITGRTHQIRVQFASRKMPVFGDGKYGASDNIPYIALFSSEISFPSPDDGHMLTFSHEPPQWDFLK